MTQLLLVLRRADIISHSLLSTEYDLASMTKCFPKKKKGGPSQSRDVFGVFGKHFNFKVRGPRTVRRQADHVSTKCR
jgi:hypothetical protein